MFKSGLALKPATGTGAGTTLITSGRALQNITSISCSGEITASDLTITGGTSSQDIYINNTSPTLGFTDSNSFSDSNDVYLIRGASTGKLQFQFKDDSAGTTTQTFLIDQSGNTDIAGNTEISGTLTVSTAGSSIKSPLYMAAQNSTGEGGEITLNGSNSNTGHTLDTVNGSFRIFDSNGTLLSGNSGYGLSVVNGYRVNGTQVITSSRNLTNIGTISSGAITSSGQILTTIESSTAIKSRFIMGKASGSTANGNLYLQYGSSDTVFIGAGSGGAGLDIAGTLKTGRTGINTASVSDVQLKIKTSTNDSTDFAIEAQSDNGNSLFSLDGAGEVRLAGNVKMSGTTIITSGRGLTNLTLSHGTGGTRFETNNWHYSTDNNSRFYFEASGRNFYKATTHQFRNINSSTVFNVSSLGHLHIASGGDSNASSTEYIKVGGTAILTSSRVLQNVSGDISMFTNDSNYATQSYVGTAISNLVDSAPSTLDTLNELAAALGDDASFSTTVTNSIATKLPLAGGTLTGTLTSKAINMQNHQLYGVNNLRFNDPGVNEGIKWDGGSEWQIYESPDNQTNAAGNLQFTTGSGGGTRRATLDTSGNWNLVNGGLQIGGDSVITSGKVLQNVTGNISMFTNNSGYITNSTASLNANKITSGTLSNSRLSTDMILSGVAPRYRLTETGVTNTPNWWMVADGGNYSIRLNNTGTYPLTIFTNTDNNAVTSLNLGYDTHVQGTIHRGNMTIDSQEIDVSSGDLALDVAGNITLDAGGGNIDLKEGGTTFGRLQEMIGGLGISAGSTPTFAQLISSTKTLFFGHIEIGDNKHVRWGNGNGDLQIYHDGSDSYIEEYGTGALKILTNGLRVRNQADDEDMITANQNGAVNLFHDNTNVLQTMTGGVNITGELQADSLDIDGAVDIDGDTRITGSSGTGFALEVERGDNSADVLLAYNNGVVQTPNNYLFASRSGGASFYSQSAAVFRGGILNDQAGQALTVSDALNVTGDISSNTTVIFQASGRNLTNIGTISSGGITSSGNLVLDASGHNYIELHSSTANTRKWRFYNGQGWNQDALLIYDQDADQTALTIETGKLGINRGANSLSHNLDVGGSVAISGTQILNSSRALSNVTGNVSMFTNDAGYLTSATLGSNLNADTVDSLHASSFLRSDANDSASGTITFSTAQGIRLSHGNQVNTDDGRIAAATHGSGLNIVGTQTTSGLGRQVRIFGSLINNSNDSTYWHASNDGSGSGLDADTLDGYQSGYFATQGNLGNYLPLSGGTMTGTITSRDLLLQSNRHLMRSNHHSGHLEGSYNNVGANGAKTNPIYTIGSSYNPNDATLGNMYGVGFASSAGASYLSFTGASNWGLYVAADGDARVFLDGSNGVVSSTGQHYVGSNVVWNAGNDGAGSGLDADLLDGQQGSYYLNYNNFSNTPSIPSVPVTSYSNGADNRVITGTSSSGINGESTFTYNGTSATLYGSGLASEFNVYHSDGAYTQQVGYGIRFSRGASYLQPTAGDSKTLYIGGASPDSSDWVNVYVNVQGNNNLKVRNNTVWNAGNDGSGSGLDADLLDGINSSSFLRSDADDNFTANSLGFPTLGLYITNNNSAPGSHYIRGNSSHIVHGTSNGNIFYLNYGNSSGSLRQYGAVYQDNSLVGNLWGSSNDGSGSGLDADTVDGIHGSSFLRSDATDSVSGNFVTTLQKLQFNGVGSNSNNANASYAIYQEAGSWSHPYPDLIIGYHTGIKMGGHTSYGGVRFYNNNPTSGSIIASIGDGDQNFRGYHNGFLRHGGSTDHKIMTVGNDGSGSGFDADLLDGQHGSYYAPASSIPTVGNGTITIAAGSNMSGGGTFSVNQSGNTTITLNSTASGGGGASSSQTVTARVKANRLDYIAATSPATIFTATSGKVIVLEEAICFIDADAVSASGYPVFGYPIRVRVKSQWNNSSDAYIHRDGGMTFTKEALNSLFRSNSQSANYSANMKRFLVAQPRDPTAPNPDMQQQIAEVNSSDGTFNSKIELTMDSYVNTSTSEDYYFYFQVKFREVTLSDITGASGMVTI